MGRRRERGGMGRGGDWREEMGERRKGMEGPRGNGSEKKMRGGSNRERERGGNGRGVRGRGVS